MKVWLDDTRTPPDGWVWVKTALEAIDLLKAGGVEAISLDHDLGDDQQGTGYQVLTWVEEQVFTREDYQPPKITIHTGNISARVKMELGLASILRKMAERGETAGDASGDEPDETVPDREGGS